MVCVAMIGLSLAQSTVIAQTDESSESSADAADLSVELTTRDGQQVRGILGKIQANSIAVLQEREESQKTFEFEKVQSIRVESTANSKKPNVGRDRIVLVDGSTLSLDKLGVSSDAVSGYLMSTEFQFSRRNVDSILFRQSEFDSELDDGWREMLAAGLQNGDRLIIERGGQLQPLDGVIQMVSGESTRFKMGEREADIGLEKITGMMLYHASGRELVEPVCLVQLRDGSKIYVREIDFDSGADLQVTLVCGDKISFPLEKIAVLDFAAGRIAILSEMKPTSVRWEPLIASSKLVSVLTEMNLPRFNQSYSGDTLSLVEKQAESIGAETRKTEYANGWAARGGTRIVFPLGGSFKLLSGVVGFSSAQNFGNVRLVIRGDGKVLLDSVMQAETGTVERLEIDVTGVDRLIFEIQYNDGRDAGDELHFCDMKVSK